MGNQCGLGRGQVCRGLVDLTVESSLSTCHSECGPTSGNICARGRVDRPSLCIVSRSASVLPGSAGSVNIRFKGRHEIRVVDCPKETLVKFKNIVQPLYTRQCVPALPRSEGKC